MPVFLYLGVGGGGGHVFRSDPDRLESRKESGEKRSTLFAFDNSGYVSSADLSSTPRIKTSARSDNGEAKSSVPPPTPSLRRQQHSELQLENPSFGYPELQDLSRDASNSENTANCKIALAEDHDPDAIAADGQPYGYDVCGRFEPGETGGGCGPAPPILTSESDPRPAPAIDGWSVHLVVPISQTMLENMRRKADNANNPKITLNLTIDVPKDVLLDPSQDSPPADPESLFVQDADLLPSEVCAQEILRKLLMDLVQMNCEIQKKAEEPKKMDYEELPLDEDGNEREMEEDSCEEEDSDDGIDSDEGYVYSLRVDPDEPPASPQSMKETREIIEKQVQKSIYQ